MRHASAQTLSILEGSFELTYQADLIYNDVVLFQNLPISTPSLSWDSTADVEGSGSCEVLWTDDYATSLKPDSPQDWLAPFGTRLVIYAVISVPPFRERIPLGVYTITAVPSADDYPLMYQHRRITVGSRVQLDFSDRMVEVQDDRFSRLAQPSQLFSVYTELAVLTGFQLTRTIPDGPITRKVVYEESRIKACQALAEIIGGVPFMESDGTLSLRPIRATTPVAALTVGETGTIVQVGSAMSREGVYNGVVIRGETDEQGAILAERWVMTGPLAATQPGGPRTPFHRRPAFYSSPFITTQAQADAAISALLDRYSATCASQLDITCVVNPLLQVGDVVTVWDGAATWTIRLVKITIGTGPTMSVTGDVIDRV